MESPREFPDERVAFDIAPTSARIISRAIDLVMIFAVATLVLGIFVGAGLIDSEELETPSGESDLLILLAFFGAAVLYEVLLTAIRGKTLGKMLTRSKVISTVRDGPPGFGAALIRLTVWIIPLLLLDVIGLAITFGVFAWAFLDANRQGLHDKIASTYVVIDHPVTPGDRSSDSG